MSVTLLAKSVALLGKKIMGGKKSWYNQGQGVLRFFDKKLSNSLFSAQIVYKLKTISYYLYRNIIYYRYSEFVFFCNS